METGIESGYEAHDNLERQKGNTERGGESGFRFRLTYGPIYRNLFNVHEGCPHELFSNHQRSAASLSRYEGKDTPGPLEVYAAPDALLHPRESPRCER